MKFKGIISIILTSTLLFGCIGCNSSKTTENTNDTESSTNESQNSEITFTDDLGNEITINSPKHVAVASESLTNAYILAGGTVYMTTDDALKSNNLPDTTENMGSVKTPSVEKILNSDVDLVILSGTISSEVKIKEQLNNANIPTAYFNIEYFDDYARMLKIFTDITGRKDLYKKNVEDVKAEIDIQKKKVKSPSPSVLLLRAYSKGVTAKGSDSMTGAMLKDLGCTNVADDKKSFGDLSMEAIISADPDYIFVTTMGESDEAAMTSLNNMLISNPAWNNLKAIKEKHYYVLDKELFHNKPNEKWGKSYEILADILYPQK